MQNLFIEMLPILFASHLSVDYRVLRDASATRTFTGYKNKLKRRYETEIRI